MSEVTIYHQPSEKISRTEALFVSFPYNMELIKCLKDEIPERWFHAETKSWEFPVDYTEILVDIFEDFGHTVTIIPMKRHSNYKVHSKTTPFEHQITGVQYGLSKDCFILADDQGLGKTKQLIDIAITRKNAGEVRRCLIIVGVNDLTWTWREQIAIHSNEKCHILGQKVISRGRNKGRMKVGSIDERLDDLVDIGDKPFFLITNKETIRKEVIQQQLQWLIQEKEISMVIVDEFHKMRNKQSKQGEAIHALQPKYKAAATGTPALKNPLDLYNMLKWIGVEKRSFWAFRNKYCEMGGFGGYQIVGWKNMNELKRTLSSAMIRRRKSEVLDLPPKLYSTEYVEMDKEQSKLYDEVVEALQKDIDKIMLDPNPLARLIRLRQATGNPSILTSRKVSCAKLKRMSDLVEEITDNGKKVLIFSQWTEVLEGAAEYLVNFNPLMIHGGVKNAQLQDILHKFKTDDKSKVLLASTYKVGTGYTLTEAETVIFLDSPWNPGDKVQAEDRIHRIGTTGTVNIITLVTLGTMDERVEEICYTKEDIINKVVEGKSGNINFSREYISGVIQDILFGRKVKKK